MLTTLPDSEEGELRPDQAVSQLVAERLEGEQTVEEAVAAGAFWRRVNPEPRGNTGHLARARAVYRGYYCNSRHHDFSTYSVLLAVGSDTGSTTQAELGISYDSVVACAIVPRTLEELRQMATETLQVRAAMCGAGWQAGRGTRPTHACTAANMQAGVHGRHCTDLPGAALAVMPLRR